MRELVPVLDFYNSLVSRYGYEAEAKDIQELFCRASTVRKPGPWG